MAQENESRDGHSVSHGPPDRSAEASIYWLSFALRCLLGLLAWWASWYTDLSLVEDAITYETLGRRIAQEWLDDGQSPTLQSMMASGQRAWGMAFSLAAISFLLGGARALPAVILFFNLITAWTPVLIYRTGRQLGLSGLGALHASRFVIFSPVFAFFGGALYKEGIVLFVLSNIVYHALVLQERVRPGSILMVALGFTALLSVRFYLAVLLLPGIVLGLLLGRRWKGPTADEDVSPASTVMRKVFVSGALIVLLVVLGSSSGILNIIPQSSGQFLGRVQASRTDLATAQSGYLRGTDVSTPLAAVKFLPLGVLYFLTVPLPWQLGSLRQSLVIPEMVFWLLQYPRIFRGMKIGLHRNPHGSLLLISITLAMICLYGLFVGNVGTAYRLRAQVWLFWTLFAGWRKEQTGSALQPESLDERL